MSSKPYEAKNSKSRLEKNMLLKNNDESLRTEKIAEKK